MWCTTCYIIVVAKAFQLAGPSTTRASSAYGWMSVRGVLQLTGTPSSIVLRYIVQKYSFIYLHLMLKIFRMLEEHGLLNHKDDLDLYCLHLCFGPLLEKSVSRFQRMWNGHKHRGLRNKTPAWVFFQSLMHLKAHANKHKLYYKELDQV